MTKIDTKEWLEASENYDLDSYERAFAFMCKSYDEAQKEIELLKGAMRADDERLSQAAKKADILDCGCDTPDIMADEILSGKQRISTLEALLGEVSKIECIRCDREGFYYCIYCDEHGSGCFENDIKHKSDCLSTRIQKELGEG